MGAYLTHNFNKRFSCTDSIVQRPRKTQQRADPGFPLMQLPSNHHKAQMTQKRGDWSSRSKRRERNRERVTGEVGKKKKRRPKSLGKRATTYLLLGPPLQALVNSSPLSRGKKVAVGSSKRREGSGRALLHPSALLGTLDARFLVLLPCFSPKPLQSNFGGDGCILCYGQR